jgi:hypothetical protein
MAVLYIALEGVSIKKLGTSALEFMLQPAPENKLKLELQQFAGGPPALLLRGLDPGKISIEFAAPRAIVPPCVGY